MGSAASTPGAPGMEEVQHWSAHRVAEEVKTLGPAYGAYADIVLENQVEGLDALALAH